MPLPSDLQDTGPHTEWTAEMARVLPDDGNRYEVLDGELFVTPAPEWGHQGVIANLHFALTTYARRSGIGRVLMSPADIEFSPRRLVQPDLFVVPAHIARNVRTWRDVSSLLLAVEVLSPSTARADRTVKRRIYLEEGVGEYWIVDLDARCIERWRQGDERPEIVSTDLRWHPSPAVEPLVLGLGEVFEEQG